MHAGTGRNYLVPFALLPCAPFSASRFTLHESALIHTSRFTKYVSLFTDSQIKDKKKMNKKGLYKHINSAVLQAAENRNCF
jgi:hypothetical protein